MLTPRPPPFDGSARFVSDYGAVVCLICSEILEISKIARAARRPELVLVPAWNKDTFSFDHLIQSAAIELHAFVAVANNGDYSDCRIRSPRKDHWAREEARLLQRALHGQVSAVLKIAELRRFHEGRSRPEDPTWKPLPPGY